MQAIADANPGADGHPSRNSGEPGYKASVDYVANLMRKAGYDVTHPAVHVHLLVLHRDANLERDLTHRAQLSRWSTTGIPGQPAGRDGRPSQAGGRHRHAADADPELGERMHRGRLHRLYAGKIALIQRGTCNFGVKVLNATAAGAVGVVIFNEGNPGRTGVFSGSMVDADSNPFVPDIPVAFTSFAIGQSLYNEYQAGTPPVMNLSIHEIVDPNRTDYNLIAESKGGDPEPRRGRRRAPRRDLRRGHARQRLRLGDDPRHRPGDAQGPPAEQAALHLVRRRGARRAGLRSTTSTTSRASELGEDPLRPRRRRDGDAELLHRRPRPGGRGPVRAHGQQAVPAAGVRAVEVRPRHGGQLLRLDREEPHLLLAGREPTRSSSSWRAFPPAAC